MKNILILLFLLLSFSAFSQTATQVTYTDKDKNAASGSPEKLFRDVDANELKNAINDNADILDDLGATITSGLAGKQATLVSGSNIKTVQGTTVLGAGDIDLVDDTATNGITDKAPSQNWVFDELALRVLLSSFVDNEVPSGTVNSSNVTFTLANTPVSGSVHLYQNGLRMKGGGVDYSISGSTITFTTAPTSGDLLLCDYRK